MRLGLALTGLVVVALLAGATGCRSQRYLGEQGQLAFALTEDTAPFAAGEEGEALYLVEERIEFPIREPTQQQLSRLQSDAEGMELPFPRLPWVRRDDMRIEVDWVVSNLQDGPVEFELLINGFNEFHEYRPSFVNDDGEIVADFAQWERRIRLEPFERRRGTIREEAFDEVEVDLATVVNGAPNANQIVHPQNHSDRDPRAKPYIPAVIPGLTGFRMGIRARGAANIVVEASVRVRDSQGRLVAQDNAWELPEPQQFSPGMNEGEQDMMMQ